MEDARYGLIGSAIAAFIGIVAIAFTAFEKLHWALALFLMLFLLLWLVAWLSMADPRKHAFLTGTLRHSRYTQIYAGFTRPTVDWIWNSVCDPAADKASWPALLRRALTWRLYDKALLFAVAYPILLLIGQWVVAGNEARLGSFPVLPDAEFWPARAAVFGSVLILTAGKIGQKFTVACERLRMRRVTNLTLLVAYLIAIAFALAFLGNLAVAFLTAFVAAGAAAGAGALAFVGAGSVAIAIAFAVSVTSVIAFSGAVIGTVAVLIAVQYLDRLDRSGLARLMLTGLVFLTLFVAALAFDWPSMSEDSRSVFLFLGVLPVFNALFDFLSYAVTLSLIRRGLNSRWPFLWGVADFLIALALFCGLGFTLVLAVHGLNILAGAQFIDFGRLFAGIRNRPQDFIWLYMMLFSTIAPTALHGLVSLIGLQGIWSKAWRGKLADLIAGAPASLPIYVLASGLLGFLWTIPVMGLVLLGWLVLWLGAPAISALMGIYFDFLLWGAAIPIGAV